MQGWHVGSPGGAWRWMAMVLGVVGWSAGCNECLLDDHITELAGPGARDCGHVQVDASRRAVDACAVEAFEAGESFSATYDVRGAHSVLTLALVHNPAGEVWWLLYDSNPQGEDQVGPRISRTRCIGPYIDQAPELATTASATPSGGSRFINCQDTTSPEVVCAED